MHANASHHANRDYEQIAKEILAEADAVDREEDEQHGTKRGDELPPHLSSSQGRNAWLRDARRRLDDQSAQEAKPIPKSRSARLKQAKRRLDEQLDVECAANTAYEAYRARGVMKNGRRMGAPPKPYQPPLTPAGKVNVTDPDSRNVKTPRGYMQGYNVQAAVNEQQVVIAAEVTIDSPDFGHLDPMVIAVEAELIEALGRDVGVDGKTIKSHLDVLERLFLIRVRRSWHVNLGKRQVKAPKLYISDPGLLAALIGADERRLRRGRRTRGLAAGDVRRDGARAAGFLGRSAVELLALPRRRARGRHDHRASIRRDHRR